MDCKENNIPIIRIPFWEIDNLVIEDLMINSKFLVGGFEEDDGEN